MFIIYNPRTDEIGCHMTSDDTGRVPTLYATPELAAQAILEHDRDRRNAAMPPERLSIRGVSIDIQHLDPRHLSLIH